MLNFNAYEVAEWLAKHYPSLYRPISYEWNTEIGTWDQVFERHMERSEALRLAVIKWRLLGEPAR